MISSKSALEQAEIANLVHALCGLGSAEAGAALSHLTERVQESWAVLGQKISLSDDDRLMLRLVYQENLPVTEAARLLDLPAHQVRRPLQRVIQRIGDVLAAEGVDFADLFD